MLNPQPPDEELRRVYAANYFLCDETPEQRAGSSGMRRATARLHLDLLASYRGMRGGRLLEIGCGRGDFLVEARAEGFEVTGVEISSEAANVARSQLEDGPILCGRIDQLGLPGRSFDVCVLIDVIEHLRDPVSALESIHHVLKPGGVVFIQTPSRDSWPARLLKQRWMEFKSDHLFYFDQETIQHLLCKTGYHEVVLNPAKKVLTIEYIRHHFERFRVLGLTPLIRCGYHLTPRVLRPQRLTLYAGGMTVMARTADLHHRRKLSVIVPVYNERGTFRRLMDSLIRKEIDGVDMDIVVVESNSTDGTREDVLQYQADPRVKIVLEERPRGKGHAVRTGLEHVEGDFVLIQDADLEYDLEDYDALLEPLRHFRKAFVLGSRHTPVGTGKIREFERQPMLAAVLNLGHAVFAFLLNIMFGARLKDPFTMYKVFRRDCLYGLSFTCNRFDFDFELVVKLLRKGYKPLEIPVNYRSRSFADGKKISPFLDPLTWLWALIRLRFSPLYESSDRPKR